MRRRLAVLSVAAAAAVGAASAHAQSVAPSFVPQVVAKTCGSGYTHAVIGGVEKCLHAGQFCAHRYDSQYRLYGYLCIKYDTSVGRYRLTRA